MHFPTTKITPVLEKQEERHGLKQLSKIVMKKQSSKFFSFFEKVGKNIVYQPLPPNTIQ